MKLFLLGLMLTIATTADAIVDMKNANYAQSWVDLEVPGTGYALNQLMPKHFRACL
jgi:hypothetical protein